jgi:hypothetical protein
MSQDELPIGEAMSEPLGDEPRTYTKAETAAILNLSMRTLDRLKAEGRIGFRQHARRGKVIFTQRNIDDFLAVTSRQLELLPPKRTYRRGSTRRARDCPWWRP